MPAKSFTKFFTKNKASFKKLPIAGKVSLVGTATGLPVLGGYMGYSAKNTEPGKERYSSSSIDLMAGAASGIVAAAATHPLDTIAIRAQASGTKLYAGFGPKLLKSIPTAVVGFATYGGTKRKLEDWQMAPLKKDVLKDMKKTASIGAALKFTAGLLGTSRKFTKPAIAGMATSVGLHSSPLRSPKITPLQEFVTSKKTNPTLNLNRVTKLP